METRVRFVRTSAAVVVVASLAGAAYSVFHRTPARNLPVQIGVLHRGMLTITSVMNATDVVSPPMMVGTHGDSAYYLAFSRRGQSLGAELVRSQVPLEGAITETVTSYNAALVGGRLVLHPYGQPARSATALRGRAYGTGLLITDPNARRGELALHPGSMDDFTKLEARVGAQQAKLASQA